MNAKLVYIIGSFYGHLCNLQLARLYRLLTVACHFVKQFAV